MAWQKPTNVSDWLGLLLRHKARFFFPAIVVMILVIWSSKFLPREYKAEAKFSRRNDPALVQMGGGTNLSNLDTVRREMWEDITGRVGVERLISDLQMTRDLPHTADGQLTAEGQLKQLDMIRAIGRSLRVYYQIQADAVDIVVVSYTADNPKLAADVANQAVENYIRKTRLRLDEMLLQARNFFQNQVTHYKSKVDELESNKMLFTMNNPGLSPDDPLALRNRLAETRANLSSAEQQAMVTEQKRLRLEEFVKNQPEFLENKRRGQNPLISAQLDKRKRIEDELDNHRALGRRDEHPMVVKAQKRLVELDAEIAKLEPEVELNKDLVPNTGRIQAEQELTILTGELAGLERRRAELRSQLDALEVMDRNFRVKRLEYVAQERELAEAQRQLVFWDDNLRRVITALTAEVGQRGVRLAFEQRATELARPSSPTVSKILMAAIAAGLAVGAGVVFLSELFDGSYHSVEQAVDGLKLPVLGAVNEIVTPQQALRKRIIAFGVYPSLAVIMVAVLLTSMGLVYLSLQDPLRYDQVVSPVRNVAQRVLGV